MPEQQGVAIDRLRQHAAERAPVELAVDGVEAQPDRHQRDHEGERGDEGDRRLLRRDREDAQEQVLVRLRDLAQRLQGEAHRQRAEHDHEQGQHQHAGAAEMIGQFLDEDRPDAGERTSPHAAPDYAARRASSK